MNWLLNAIGVLIYFINRYAKRTKRTVKFSLKFWIQDSAAEMLSTVLMNVALMLILQEKIKDGTIEQLYEKLPDWIVFLGVPGLCFGLGLGLSALFYTLFKTKIKNVKG